MREEERKYFSPYFKTLKYKTYIEFQRSAL